MRIKPNITVGVGAGCFAIFIAIIIGWGAYYERGTRRLIDITISEKERMVTGSGEDTESFWIVLADEGEFSNKDSLFNWKWDSTTLQRKLKIGHRYQVEVFGWRVPFLSMYPNILRIKKEYE